LAETLSALFVETVAELAIGTAEDRKEKALSHAISELYPHLWKWAIESCKAHGDRSCSHAEDLVSEFSMEVVEILTREAGLNPEKSPVAVKHWYSYVHTATRSVGWNYFRPSGYLGFTGADGIARRVSKINRARSILTSELEREPSLDEIVSRVNRAAESLKDARKQGAIVTADDVRIADGNLLRSTSLDALVSGADYDREDFAVGDDDGLLSRVEAKELVAIVIRECYRTDWQLGIIAKSWIGESLSEPPIVRSVGEIARAVDLTQPKAAAGISECQRIGTACLRARFGIESESNGLG
jgi:hypothetical protein